VITGSSRPLSRGRSRPGARARASAWGGGSRDAAGTAVDQTGAGQSDGLLESARSETAGQRGGGCGGGSGGAKRSGGGSVSEASRSSVDHGWLQPCRSLLASSRWWCWCALSWRPPRVDDADGIGDRLGVRRLGCWLRLAVVGVSGGVWCRGCWRSPWSRMSRSQPCARCLRSRCLVRRRRQGWAP
jgi:hypothetical protein